MAQTKAKAPKVAKKVTPAIINEYAFLKMMCSRIEKRMKELKEDYLLPEADPLTPLLRTNENLLTYSENTFDQVDVPSIRADKGEEWLKPYMKPVTRKEFKVVNFMGFHELSKNVELDANIAKTMLGDMLGVKLNSK